MQCWEDVPLHYNLLDVTSCTHEDNIEEVRVVSDHMIAHSLSVLEVLSPSALYSTVCGCNRHLDACGTYMYILQCSRQPF